MAGGYKNIHKHPKANTAGFDKKPENIYRGDRKQFVSSIQKWYGERGEEEPSANQILVSLLALSAMPLSKIRGIIEKAPTDDEIETFVAVTARELAGKNGFNALMRLLHVMAAKLIDITTKGDKIQLSETEAISRIKELESLLSDDQS